MAKKLNWITIFPATIFQESGVYKLSLKLVVIDIKFPLGEELFKDKEKANKYPTFKL